MDSSTTLRTSSRCAGYDDDFLVHQLVSIAEEHKRTMLIREYKPSDWDEWLRMSKALFPVEWTEGDVAEMHATLARADAAVIVLEPPDGRSLAGFVEVGARSIVDGCLTNPVGYIEAWYVDPDARLAGYGRALLEAAEEWARSDVGAALRTRSCTAWRA